MFCQKRPAADFIDPLANKKPRISHLASKAATVQVNGKLGSSCGRGDSGGVLSGAAVSTSEGGLTSSSQPLPMLDIPRPFEALSDVSNDSSNNGRDCESQETTLAERLSQPPAILPVSTVATTPSIGTSSSGHTVLEGPRDNSPSVVNNKPKKKSKKHKDKEKSKDKGKGREKEKICQEPVSEPKAACEMSPRNFKNNSIAFKSTGNTDAFTCCVTAMNWDIS